MRLRKSSGLVMCIGMDEGSGAVAGDSSRYGNDGAVNGGVVWTEKGMRFDGSIGYLDCGNDPSIKMLTNDFSCSMWINTNNNTNYNLFIEKRGYELRINHLTSKIYGYVRNEAAEFASLTPTSTTITDGDWHHIVLTVERSENAYIYVNSMVSSTTDVSGLAGNLHNTDPLKLSTATAVYSFNGSIDQVRIHNRALSAREIMKYYEATKHKYL